MSACWKPAWFGGAWCLSAAGCISMRGFLARTAARQTDDGIQRVRLTSDQGTMLDHCPSVLVEGTESCGSIDEEGRAPPLVLPEGATSPQTYQPSRATLCIRRTQDAIYNALRRARNTGRAV